MSETETRIDTVFPNATGEEPPESAGKIFRTYMRDWFRNNLTMILVTVVAVALMSVGGIASGYPWVGIVLVGILLVAAGIFAAVKWNRLEEQFFREYARTRGLEYRNNMSLTAATPLLRKGDKRKYEHTMYGTVCGVECGISMYTYTDVSRDSDGNRQETDYRYTILQFTLPPAVAARYRGVYVRDRSISFGRLQDKLAHDRGVKLSSTEFIKKYDLRVVDEQDDIALYELFSTPFIARMIEDDFRIEFEQIGNKLVVFEDSHCSNTKELDSFATQAQIIVQRYLEEYQ